MTKTLLNEVVQQMPNEFSIDELLERLMLIESIEKGRKQFQEGKVLTHQEVGKKLEKWLK
jgi:predicted transcriptional regulator